MIFQHFCREVSACLNTLCPGNWIEHVRTTPRLLCSAYWAPLDVRLRDFMMDVVYVSPVLHTALNCCSASRVVYEVDQYKLQCIWEE
jgi:hypothetical protein